MNTIQPVLAFQPFEDDEPQLISEVIQFDPYGRNQSEVLVMMKAEDDLPGEPRIYRTSTRYLRILPNGDQS